MVALRPPPVCEAAPRVYWFEQSPAAAAPGLQGTTDADVVVVGGGIAGLSAAQWLREEAELDVVLLEADLCGSGATGRSSGFITPDSELELNQLARRFGDDAAVFLWRSAQSACDLIRRNIDRYGISCDFIPSDSLYTASSRGGTSAIREEHEAHRRLGFESRLYTSADLPLVLAGRDYPAAIRTPGTFAINGFAYAQGLKQALIALGVRIHERSPVTSIGPRRVNTTHGHVRAGKVILCLDRFAPQLGIAPRDIYHAQAFILLSEPLDDSTWARIFPGGPMLVWDTDLIYQYFRRTAEGRLLIGGGLLRETYARDEHPSSPAFAALARYIRRRFPHLRDVRFTHRWPGLIGITKDILPIAGQSPAEPSHYYAMAAAGLPWSTLAGRAAAAGAIDRDTTYDRFFSPSRAFSTVEPLQPLLGRAATWGLSYYLSKNLERGDSRRVAARQRALRTSVLLAAAAAGGLIGHRLSRRGAQSLVSSGRRTSCR